MRINLQYFVLYSEAELVKLAWVSGAEVEGPTAKDDPQQFAALLTVTVQSICEE